MIFRLTFRNLGSALCNSPNVNSIEHATQTQANFPRRSIPGFGSFVTGQSEFSWFHYAIILRSCLGNYVISSCRLGISILRRRRPRLDTLGFRFDPPSLSKTFLPLVPRQPTKFTLVAHDSMPAKCLGGDDKMAWICSGSLHVSST